MNACEWVLNTPWMLLSAYECLWVSVEHPLNATECTWMRLSENWTAPEHPLSVHECLWVSIAKVWMRTSRMVNVTNLLCRFKLRIKKIGINLWYCFTSNGYGKTCTNFSDLRQDTFGTLILHCLVTVYLNGQQNCLELQEIVHLAISFAQFIPTSLSSCTPFLNFHCMMGCKQDCIQQKFASKFLRFTILSF